MPRDRSSCNVYRDDSEDPSIYSIEYQGLVDTESGRENSAYFALAWVKTNKKGELYFPADFLPTPVKLVYLGEKDTFLARYGKSDNQTNYRFVEVEKYGDGLHFLNEALNKKFAADDEFEVLVGLA